MRAAAGVHPSRTLHHRDCTNTQGRPRRARAGVSKGIAFHSLAVEELPVDKETIPGTSPFGVNEVIRTQDSDADVDPDHRPRSGG